MSRTAEANAAEAVGDLRETIQSLARGSSDYDGERVEAIARADALDCRDLVPDNWNDDGSLADSARVWDGQEERETYNDVCKALADALNEYTDDCWCWLQDFDDDYAYYQADGSLCRVPYSIDPAGPITFGESETVRPVTSFVPTDRAAQPVLRNTIAARRQRMPKRGDIERRSLPIEEFEIRDSDLSVRDGESELSLVEFRGYASVFEHEYRVGSYEEKIARGAFKRSLSNPKVDVVLRTEHVDLPIARTTGRITLVDGTEVPTLRLAEDDHGLEVRALLDPTDPDVQRLLPKYRRGDLKEMSFAFRAQDDLWSDDYSKRTIKAAELHRGDVSIVTFGASQETTSSMRSEEIVAELRSIGAEGMVGSLQEFAFQWVAQYLSLNGEERTIAELEGRVGKVLSSGSLEALRTILQLIATADDAVDEAQPLLADLMGVPNPDEDDEDEEDGGDGEQLSADTDKIEDTVVDLPPARYDEYEFELRALGGGR